MVDRSVFRSLLIDKASTKPNSTRLIHRPNGGKQATSFAQVAAKEPAVLPAAEPTKGESVKLAPSVGNSDDPGPTLPCFSTSLSSAFNRGHKVGLDQARSAKQLSQCVLMRLGRSPRGCKLIPL
jgi:hypothetical protein